MIRILPWAECIISQIIQYINEYNNISSVLQRTSFSALKQDFDIFMNTSNIAAIDHQSILFVFTGGADAIAFGPYVNMLNYFNYFSELLSTFNQNKLIIFRGPTAFCCQN